MQKVLFISALCATLSANNVLAQSNSKIENHEDKIIIEKKNLDKNTTIEIKDGEVFVDGKKVDDIPQENRSDKNVKVFKQRRMFINGKEVPIDDKKEWDIQPFEFSPDGEVKGGKPMLGVTTKPAKNNEGAEIETVSPNSPAQKLGLQAGDVITRINNKNIYTPKDLVEAIGEFNPGDMIDVTFERNNKLSTKNVQLTEREDITSFRRMMPFGDDMMESFAPFLKQFQQGDFENGIDMPFPAKAPAPKMGISVEDRADNDGVMVNEVLENSVAEKAGLKKQDIIISYAGIPVSSVDNLLEIIQKNQSKNKTTIEVKRNGKIEKLELEIPKVLKKKDL